MRTASGDTTATTSPLIHVHEAESSRLVFELACKEGLKFATPATVETVLPRPMSVALVGAPAASNALATEREHVTDTAVMVSPELSTRVAAIGALGGIGASAVEERK